MYFIYDVTADSQRFPLLPLLQTIVAVIYGPSKAIWRVAKVRGYGLAICTLEDDVIAEDIVEIEAESLIGIAQDPTQWFYDVDCSDDDKQIRFGLFDSTALFIDGDNVLIPTVLAAFTKVDSR